jgi:hypothetical protein
MKMEMPAGLDPEVCTLSHSWVDLQGKGLWSQSLSIPQSYFHSMLNVKASWWIGGWL